MNVHNWSRFYQWKKMSSLGWCNKVYWPTHTSEIIRISNFWWTCSYIGLAQARAQVIFWQLKVFLAQIATTLHTGNSELLCSYHSLKCRCMVARSPASEFHCHWNWLNCTFGLPSQNSSPAEQQQLCINMLYNYSALFVPHLFYISRGAN